MPYKIEFQLAAGKSYSDGAQKESHFIIVDDDLDPREFDNVLPLEKLMAQRIGCDIDDIFHWWHSEVEVPMLIDFDDVTPIESFDDRLIGTVVYCGIEFDVMGFVTKVSHDLKQIEMKLFNGELFIFPFSEVHGIVKHEAFK